MVWWFIVPKVTFGEDALSDLELLSGKKAIIVTDEVINSLGHAEKVKSLLEENGWEVSVWDGAEPDPRVSVVKNAAQAMTEFAPDWIIAVGGGSVMDTAKAAWILYEHPDTKLESVNPLQPLDLRQKARLVCIPTTAGTGSEATKAMVIREDETGRKFATNNNELVPDLAILDPELVIGLPRDLTAYTGMDVLAHSVDAYVSVWKNDFSDACTLQAVRMVFEWLPKSIENLKDTTAREKMLVAASLAGMSFSNSQVCLSHSLGHCMGSVHRLQHGLSVGMALPYTIEYNAHDTPDTAKQYADLAGLVGILEKDDEKAARKFAAKIRVLQKDIGAPTSFKDAGMSKEDFEKGLDKLVEFTMMDTSITMNPRFIDSETIRKVYEYMFEGTPIDF
ncbi:MAG: iron-containing alcohol dehydrogenase [Candidatus Thorarchaeota archaeon]|jgi:alcohol dehydrogenase class IV